MNMCISQTASGICLPDCSKSAINPKNNKDVTIFWHDVIVKFCWRCFIFFVKFSYWSKFHVNIITGSGVTTFFFYKGLTRNPEVWNISVWVLPNIWKLGEVKDTKFGTNVDDDHRIPHTQHTHLTRLWTRRPVQRLSIQSSGLRFRLMMSYKVVIG